MKKKRGSDACLKPRKIIDVPLTAVPESTYEANSNSPCFILTSKGSLKLCDDNGYRYIKNRIETGKTYWNCERKKSDCRARAISRSGETKVVFSVMNHNHLPPSCEKKNDQFPPYSVTAPEDGKLTIFLTVGFGYSHWFCLPSAILCERSLLLRTGALQSTEQSTRAGVLP